MKQTIIDSLIVISVAGIVFLTNLGGTHLWDRDEPRNAGCAAEMLAANDWVTPTFNAKLREHKPVLTYWLMMLSYSAFGVTEFGARFPSALLGIGTALLTWFIGRRLFGPRTGIWAGIAIATTMMFGVASRAATPDASLIFFSTLAIAFYIAGTTRPFDLDKRVQISPFESLFPRGNLWPILMYSSMGMAVLAKGPIGLVLPTAVVGMFLLIKRLANRDRAETTPTLKERLAKLVSPFAPTHFLKTCWSMRPLTAISCVLAIALPWYVWVHFRTDGEWTYGFFVKHNVGRAMNSMDGHDGGIFFYPLMLIVGFFPWSIFWIPTLLDGVKQLKTKSRSADGYLFAFCWAGVYLALFSIAKTKLPSYITPCYPGVALAIGAFVDRWSRQEFELAKIWPRLAFGSMITVGLGVVVGIPIAASYFVPEETLLGLLGLIPLAGGIVALVAAEEKHARRAVLSTAITAVLMSPAIFAFAADRIDQHRQVDALVRSFYGDASSDSVDVISYANSEASWIFYARQPIEHFRDAEHAAVALFTRSATGQQRALVTTSDRVEELRSYFLPDQVEVETLPYLLEDSEIVVLKPKNVPILASEEQTETIIR